MRKENGMSTIGLIFIIVILIIIAVIAINKIFGKNGIWNEYKKADTDYNKTEIVDCLDLIIKEKYVLDSKAAIENKQDVNQVCTSENMFKYLLDEGYIEQLKDIKDNLVQDQYYINAEKLDGDIVTNVINANGSESNGTKIFKIKKTEEKYMIYFVDKYGEEEELEELVLIPEV